nr:cytochrome P450 [Pararoseomonas baculiformis]
MATDEALWPMGRAARLGWRLGLALAPGLASALRPLSPLRLGRTVVALRHDHVREVFRDDPTYAAPYAERLAVITGGEAFLLGLRDGPDYQAALRALRGLLELPGDAERVGRDAAAIVEAGLPTSGPVETVGLFRSATFEAVARWLGVPEVDGTRGRLAVWGTRLFGFQFGGGPAPSEAEAQPFAEAMRAHVAAAVTARKAEGRAADDLLGRALRRQADGDPWFTDGAIRTALLCLLVGGPPQPPMLAANALNQLLRRPDALARAQHAARAGDEGALRRIVREAMRFDPLAPALQRVAVRDGTLAAGTSRARAVPAGAEVLAAIASAMMDGRRVEEPWRFRPNRPDADYLHFGHGLHECYGRELNAVLIHRLLLPLLLRPGLARAPGAAGRLTKRGVHAERLAVAFAP